MIATVLDWRHHRIGPLRPCRYCHRDALLRDEHGEPAHKVCAEHDTGQATDTWVGPGR
jgi:hypothetical protein